MDTNKADITLHQALALRGMTSANEGIAQRRVIYDAAGNRLGAFDAKEAWEMLAKVEA